MADRNDWVAVTIDGSLECVIDVYLDLARNMITSGEESFRKLPDGQYRCRVEVNTWPSASGSLAPEDAQIWLNDFRAGLE